MQKEYTLNLIRREQNALSKKFGELKRAGADQSAFDEIKSQVEANKEAEKKAEDEALVTEKQLLSKWRTIGNFVHESVPVSMDEANNRVERVFGDCRPSDPKLYHHHELLHMIDGYSPVQGVAVAGHRGYFLKGVGVLLNQALINYGLAYLMKNSYTPLQPPFFMKKEVMAGTAQLEEFDEALYKVTGEGADEMYLIATSEQPISAYHLGQFLTDKQLPLHYAGYSTCFRKEAGSHGRDAWGIFRIHQFEKVEQFVITAPDQSWEAHEKMIEVAEGFYKSVRLSRSNFLLLLFSVAWSRISCCQHC